MANAIQVSDTIALMMSNKEIARKKVVRYVFLIYWMLIFEGAFRKWFFPEYHQIIFFLRDPVVLLVYITAWRNNIFQRDGFLTAGIVISLAFIPVIFLQVVIVKMNMLTLIYGWRVYFYYLPLAFVIKDAFHLDDIHKLIRQTLYVAIPLSVLVYIQFISPRASFINSGYGDGKAFVVTGNIVRTTGTFTFTAGQTLFASSLMAMLAYVWFYRKQYVILPMLWLIIATCASMTHLLLSGSRTAFFMTGLIVAATFCGLMFTNSVKMKITGTGLMAFLLLFGTILFLGPFRESFEALGTRFQQAEQSEGSAFMRAIAPLIIFTRHITTTPILGYGIGFGTGGGSQLATGKASLVLAEDEWSRVIMEGGPGFGLLFIGYRIVFTLSLLRQAITSARLDNNLLPMMFFGFIGFYIFAGQITHIGTLMGYNWIFVGLIMAAAKKQADLKLSGLSTTEPLYPNIMKIS
jgi:hypothetical protein